MLLVCSTGGHLLQLVALRERLARRTHVWVTFDKSDARSLLAGEQVLFAYGPTNRSLKNLFRNLWLALAPPAPRSAALDRHHRRRRRRPVRWIGRLHGARVVYVESFTRIARPLAQLPADRPGREPHLRAVARARGRRPARPLRRQRLLAAR